MSQSASFPSSERLIGAIKNNPEGALLLAAGAILLMRKTAAATTVSKLSEAPARDVAEAAEGARSYAADMADQTMRTASEMGTSAKDYAARTARTLGQQAERTARSTQSSVQEGIGRIVQEQPLAIALAGLAVGAALASVFPATNLEKETLGPYGDQAAAAAARVGGQLKEATLAAGQTLKTAADERGLNTEGLKKVAEQVASSFTENMGGGAKDPPGQGNPSGDQYS